MSKVRQWIDTAIKGTHRHFLSFLPENIGWVVSISLKLFYSGIRLNRSQTDKLRALAKDGIVIYVIKQKSYFDFLFFHTYYHKHRLPVPELGLGYRFLLLQPVSRLLRVFLAHADHLFTHRRILNPYKDGYFKNEILSGRIALFHLIEKRGIHHRFVKEKTDPIRFLIDLQAEIDRPIYIVSQILFFDRTPHKSVPSIFDILFGSKESPGRLRRLYMLFTSPHKVFAEVSTPFNLKAHLEDPSFKGKLPQTQTSELRQILLARINRHRQSITGPVLKSHEELKESILTGDRLRKYMRKYAARNDTQITRVYKRADIYLDEIAAKYNVAFIKIAAVIVKWITENMFEGVSVDYSAFDTLRIRSLQSPLVFIPCHKSHIDYLIISYILYINNMPCPLVAAGKNLSFWPIGPLFRMGGAFFIRRTFKGLHLYPKVFNEYIHKMLDEGYNIEFFIEGGRSRTGKLILPKLGLLSILLEGYKNGACEDLNFVPVYIGYDRVLEEASYLHEIEGGKKEPEALSQVIKAGKFLTKRYGRIFLNFHEPISLRALLARQNLSLAGMSPDEQAAFCRNLGFRVINAINNVSVVTPHALVAAAVLCCPRVRFTFNHISDHVETFIFFLSSQKAQLSDTLMSDQKAAVALAFDAYVQRKIVEPLSSESKTTDPEMVYRINENKRALLEYYKNNCISFFVPAAFSAMAILDKDAFQFSAGGLHGSYGFLRDLFKNEFAYDIERPAEFFVRKTTKAFIDDAILMPHPTLPDTYNITSAGFRKLKVYARFLAAYLESYRVVLSYFARETDADLPVKQRLKKVQARGTKMFKANEIQLPESLSTVNYKNALKYFLSKEITCAEQEDSIKRYAEAVRRYIHLCEG